MEAGRPATFKVLSDETGGGMAVIEEIVPPLMARLCTFTEPAMKRSTSFPANSPCGWGRQRTWLPPARRYSSLLAQFTGGETAAASMVECFTSLPLGRELCLIFGDGVSQAADLISVATSIPSLNVTP
jgi:hypothetical protein